MKRYIVAACAVTGAFAFTASTAVAPPPPGSQDPCKNNPTTLCDGHGKLRDNITITDEPAGPNCVNGGIKVVVQNGRKDGDSQVAFPDQLPLPPGALPESEDPGVPVTDGDGPPPPKPDEPRFNPRPRPDPPDETFFICNGATGPAGPQGPAGAPGAQGPPGAVQLPGGGTGIPTPIAKVCQSSTRIGVRMFLPPRLGRFGVIRLTVQKVNGPVRFSGNQRVRVPRSNLNGPRFVFVPLRARNCGSYLITASRGSVEPLIQIWQITGRFGLKRTTITG